MRSFITAILFILAFLSFESCDTPPPFDEGKKASSPAEADSLYHRFRKELGDADRERTMAILDTVVQEATRSGKTGLKAMGIACKGIYNTHPREGRMEEGIAQLKKAIELAEKAELPTLSALFTHYHGYALFWSGDHEGALKDLLEADLQMSELGYEKVPGGTICLYHMGKVYFDFGNYRKAEEYIQKALEPAEGKELLRLGSLNLLGNIQAEMKAYEKARKHYSQALAIAEEVGDSAQIGVTGGNLGGLYLEMEEYEKAEPFLRKGYELGKRFGLEYNRMSAQLKLLILNVELERPDKARRLAEEARKVLESSELGPEAWVEYHKGKAEFHALLGEERKAIRHYDSLTQAKDRLHRTRNASTLGDLEAQLTARRHMNEIRLLKREQELQRVKRNSILGFIILVALFISYLWYRTWQRRKQERQRFLAEQQEARRELDRFREQIREKNRRIESFRSRLNELSKHVEDHQGMQVQEEVMERLAETHILTEEDWSEFKRLFKKVHPDFFDKLLNEHSELTSAELRLMALMKLDLSVTEIAQMLGILPESVRKTRQRLVKKLNFEDHKALARFIRDL